MKKGKTSKKEEIKTGLKTVDITSKLIDVTTLSSFIRNISDHPVKSENMEFSTKATAGKNTDELYMFIVEVTLVDNTISDEDDKVCAEFVFGFMFRIENWSNKAEEKQYIDEGLIPDHLKLPLVDIVFGTIRGMLVVLLGDTMYNDVYFNVFPKYDTDFLKSIEGK